MSASYPRGGSEWEPGTPEPQLGALEEAAQAWWLGLVVGLLSVAGGVVLIVWTKPTLTVVAVLVGIELLLGGIFLIIAAFGRPAGSRAGAVLAGAVAVIAGLIVVRHPSGSVLVVALAVGIYLILAGVLRLVGAVEASRGRGWLLLGALFDLVLGIVIVAWPKFGITTLAILLGIVLIVRGLGLVLIAFVLRAAGRELAP